MTDPLADAIKDEIIILRQWAFQRRMDGDWERHQISPMRARADYLERVLDEAGR